MSFSGNSKACTTPFPQIHVENYTISKNAGSVRTWMWARCDEQGANGTPVPFWCGRHSKPRQSPQHPTPFGSHGTELFANGPLYQ